MKNSPNGTAMTNGQETVKLLDTGTMGLNKNLCKVSQSVTQESRSRSLPDCYDKKPQEDIDIETKLLEHDRPQSPSNGSNEYWFKTWPERCDKIKSTESSPDTVDNTQTCDSRNVKNQFTLNEALQNISLAYSPVTKQLHLVEQRVDNKVEVEEEKPKKGHKRDQAGSYSSTISTLSGLSDYSPSGSLLEPDQKSIKSLGNDEMQTKSFTSVLMRNVFPWKSSNSKRSLNGSSVWKLFSKSTESSNSPIHTVASSSALIQHVRPSNLPAKAVEEEQRHRDEYMAMLAAAKKKEAHHAACKQKQQKLQLQQEEQQAAANKHFTQQVLPKWNKMRYHKKTMELWWQGLPSSVRGKVWRLAIGNDLNVTQQLYEICLNRAQNRLKSLENSEPDDEESSMDVIQLDISRTFPHLCIFQEGGPYSEVLHSLLAAYVCYRPDVGYVQGMSYIAAILILNMEPFDAFICFANLLNQPLHLSAFTLNQTQMQAYYDAYNEVFSYNLPRLCSHFQACGLTPDLYLLDWIYTVFAKAMPLDVACRVWDVFLRDGYEFIFRTALGILHLNQEVLMEMDFLHGAQFLTHLPDDMSSDQLFKSIQLVTTNVAKQTFTQIVDHCLSNLLDTS